MDTNKMANFGWIALALSLGGVIAAVLVETTIARDQPGALAGFGIFVAFQVAAFVLGMLSWKDRLGKSACLTSAILACGSFLLLA